MGLSGMRTLEAVFSIALMSIEILILQGFRCTLFAWEPLYNSLSLYIWALGYDCFVDDLANKLESSFSQNLNAFLTNG